MILKYEYVIWWQRKSFQNRKSPKFWIYLRWHYQWFVIIRTGRLGSKNFRKKLMKNRPIIEYPNINDQIADNFEMSPELEQSITWWISLKKKWKQNTLSMKLKIKSKVFKRENNLLENIKTMPEMRLASYLRFFL